jgi:2-iminobutanoate/2-iminopropanoate deaminase
MKNVVETSHAPAAIGPYSQAVIYDGKLIFTAGQIGIDPATGELVPGGIGEQTVQVMENLNAVLDKGLSNFDRVLKTTIFLADIKDFTVVNEIYARYFTDKPPARSTIQVAALPKGARVEIECIAAAL